MYNQSCGGKRVRKMMILAAGVLMISACVVSSADDSGAARRSGFQTPAVESSALKAWPAFFAEFRAAVGRRDRKTLRRLMAETFNAPPHTPEDAFRRWDDASVRGWAKLRRALAQGAVSAGKPDEGDPEQERPVMISPPAAERAGYKGWFAAFEFREDGRWYCVQFTSMAEFSR
jgi:hypothetical protein